MAKKPVVVTALAKKGGPGKTTVIQGLASAAAKKGLSAWVADFDPQCNLTNLLAGPEYKELLAKRKRKEIPRPPTLFDVLSEESPSAADLRMALYSADPRWPGISLLPASAQLDLVEHYQQDVETAQRFRVAVDDLRANSSAEDLPDLLLCDTRPAFNLLTIMAVAGADVELAIGHPERFALEGLREAWATLASLIEADSVPNLDAAFVVTSKIDRRKAEHRARVMEIESKYASVLMTPELPDRTVVVQAISAGEPLHFYPDSRAPEPADVLTEWLDKIMKVSA